MKITIISVFTVVVLLSTSCALQDCLTIWNDGKPRRNTSGAIRLTMMHTQHRCSPVRRHTGLPPSWHHSMALDREQLFFRRRTPLPDISAAVTSTSAGPEHGFMTQVAIGTPPRTQTVLIDTAASFSWVQCSPCAINGCYNQDGPLFDTRTSSTYTTVPCSTQICQSVAATVARTNCSSADNTCLYRVLYTDRSVSEGCVSRDTLTVGQAKFHGFMFGCSRRYEPTFGRYSGIFGFANDRVSFFSQVIAKSRHYRAFSYHLPSPSSVGYIQVGSYDGSELAFTPMFSSKDLDYFIALTGITVDGCPLDLASPKLSGQHKPSEFVMFLDMGSAFTLLPRHVYKRLCDAVAKGIKGYDRVEDGQRCCFDPSFLSTETVLPKVQMHFRNGVRLVLNEERLMYKTTDQRLCLGFWPGDQNQFLLGSMQLQMIYVVQDVEKSLMGFQKT